MTLGKSRIFLLLCLSFIVGVFLGIFFNYYIIALGAMFFVMLATLFWRQKTFMIVGFCGLALLAGAWRLESSFPYDDPNFIGKLYGQKVEIEGIVMREPDVRADKVNITVRSSSLPHPALSDSGEGKPVGNILLNVGRYPEYQYGDKLKISGKLEEPFESEEFSYKNYLSRYDTYAVMRFPQIEKLAKNQGNPVKAALLGFKTRIVQAFSAVLPDPHNSLLLGIILGLKRSLPKDLSEALVVAGISHIVVISGFNISILTKNILELRGWFGRRITFVIALGVIFAFVIMTGAEASVIRAAVMGGMLVLALNVGRLYQSANSIIFAAAVMIFLNPKILQFDVGFQLSFLATIGILYLSPILERWLEQIKVPRILNLRLNLAATTSAIVFTLPILAVNFGRLSIVAILANVSILWVVQYIMYVGIPLGLLAAIYAPIVKVFAWLLWAMLEFVIKVTEFFARLPFAAAAVDFPLWLGVFYYLLLVTWLAWYRKRKDFHYYLEYVKRKI